ncbi:amino acid adenylation domain-containing protein [Streptomyces achromogenes]|uniref:non-ribosomal peptide synthetase n=1 Tax=Streptomyces achromogenes TaxID=67255 RepID=UPI00370268DF
MDGQVGPVDAAPARETAAEVLPATSAQERLWFEEQLDPDRALYAVPCVLELTGPVDREALGTALARLVARHEALRTGLLRQDGRLLQVVLGPDQVRAELAYEDLGGGPDHAAPAREDSDGGSHEELDGGPGPTARALERAEREFRRPFQLARPPLLRALLLRTGADRHVLVLTVHHTVCDGASVALLVDGLLGEYARVRRGEPAAPPPDGPAFADWAAWQEERLAPERERLLAHWKSALAGLTPLALPTDRERPATPDHEGAVRHTALGGARLAALRALCRAEGVGSATGLLTAVCALLHRLTGQRDVCVGMPVSRRDDPALAEVVGMLVNTVPVRVDLPGETTFREALRRTGRAVADAVAHGDLPFDEIVRATDVPRSADTPLFRVLVGHERAGAPRADGTGPAVRELRPPFPTARYDLSYYFTEDAADAALSVEYRTALFDADRVERLLGHFRTLLTAALAAPDRPLAELPLLTPEEEREAAGLATGTRGEPQPPVTEQVADWARRTPDAVAVACGGTQVTYARLAERVRRLAARLRELGAGPERPVVVAVPRSADLPVALLAVLASGSAFVPVDPGHPPAHLARVCADSGARLAVTTTAARPVLPRDGLRTLLLDDEEPLPEAPEPVAVPEPGHLAYVLYTSGSTGRPKGVMIEHRSLAGLTAVMDEVDPIGPGDTWLATSSVTFDVCLAELLWPLTRGATVAVSAAGVGRPGLAGELRRFAPTHLQVTPSAARLLLADRDTAAGLRGLRALILAGEPLTGPLVRELTRATDARLHNLYGPTEATVYATHHAGPDPEQAAAPIGRPVAGAVVHVLDERGRPCPPGVPGELWIGGTGVARGYLGQPELTRQRFTDVPAAGGRAYRTGDLARRRADGVLEFLGRLDRQVKVRGVRVEPAQVERALEEHPRVWQAVVTPRTGPAGVTELIAYAVPATCDEAELLAHLRARLPQAMVPAAVVGLDRIPLTRNGKTDFAALPEPAVRRPTAGDGPPRTDAQRAVAALWAEVLGRPGPGTDADFFASGGDSLKLVALYERLESRWPGALRLAELFDLTTVAAQAEAVERRARTAPAGPEGTGPDGGGTDGAGPDGAGPSGAGARRVEL